MSDLAIAVVGPHADIDDAVLATHRVWFFGADYERYLALSERAAGAMVPVGELINAVFERLAPELAQLDAHLWSGRSRIAWLSSDLAERNPSTSLFMLDLTRAIALVETARAGGKHLVVVDDAAFGQAIIALCRDHAIAAGWRARGKRQGRMLAAVRAHLGFWRRFWRERQALRTHKTDTTRFAGRDVVVISWAEGSSNGRDRFLGMLPEWLRAEGFATARIYNPTVWLRSIADIARAVREGAARDPSALAGCFLGINAVLRAYLTHLAFPFAVRRRLVLCGIELRSVVGLHIRRELASVRLVGAACYAGLAAAFVRAGVRPRAVFYPFENQPWEKALLAGFRRALPETTMVGVQHAPFPPRYVSAVPTRRQWAEGTAPDVITTIGPQFAHHLIAQGAPADRVIVGGALRHADLIAHAAAPLRAKVDSERVVLATCAMDFNDILDLAFKAAAATASRPGVRLVVNFHPMTEAGVRSRVRRDLAARLDCSHVEFVDGGAAEWMPRADVLLYNSSSTAFEAAAAGVPVINVTSEVGLDLDPLQGAAIARARSVDELRRQIAIMLDDAGQAVANVEEVRRHLVKSFVTPQPAIWTSLAARKPGDPAASAGSTSIPSIQQAAAHRAPTIGAM